MPDCPPFAALWLDAGRHLHLLTRDRHLADLSLTDMPQGSAIERILPQLVEHLPQPQDERWLLLIEPSLPPDWTDFPWERMTLGGQPLVRQALVVRRAAWSAMTDASPQMARYLNLFPPSEHPFAEKLQSAVAAGRLQRIEARYLAQDGVGTTDLFILAHGNAQGLLDAQGQAFSLPDWHPAPARVWLLACNVDCAMDRLAVTLLDHGCRTVIAATGDLSAPQMESLVGAWTMRTDLLLTPAVWLAGHIRNAGCEPLDGGVQALRVWGDVALDDGETSDWNQIAWKIRHGVRDAMPLDDTLDTPAFHKALTAMKVSSTWGVTREDMGPPLLWLAEKYHHPALTELERSVESCLGEVAAPDALHALASSARRLGHYGAMARYLVRSLDSPELGVSLQADCLGQLANLFIDLDLPEAALHVIARHQDIDITDPEVRRSTEFRRLDWQARAEARRGRFDVAMLHLRTKRDRAVGAMGYDGRRELAGLLYLGAWSCRVGSMSYADIKTLVTETHQHLAAAAPGDIGAGNDDNKYLLRAMAAWAWASSDTKIASFVAGWRGCAMERLAEHDPGPWAYILLFLHLAGEVGETDRECALESLVRAGYMLEAAMLAGMCEHGKARQWLQRFQQRRSEIVAGLMRAAWIDGTALETEVLRRCREENIALGQAQQAAIAGILPL